MKKALFFVLAAGLFACNSSDNTASKEEPKEEAKVAAMSTNDLAYPVKDWGDWQPGSVDNLKMVLQSLKHYENGDITACMTAFADSIHLAFDGMEGTFSKDSVAKLFTKGRGDSKTLQIAMDDYETVKSKDGKQEYVSLWYKEKWEDQKGQWDSLVQMDDLKIVNGKIASIDQKSRHFPKKKM